MDFGSWLPRLVRSPVDGFVESVDRDSPGYRVVITWSSRKRQTMIAGMRSVRVTAGQTVEAGQPIGRMFVSGQVHIEESKGERWDFGRLQEPTAPWKRNCGWETTRQGIRKRVRLAAQYNAMKE